MHQYSTQLKLMLKTSMVLYALAGSAGYAQSQPTGQPIPEATAQKAKDYFEILSQITMSLNGSKCEQILRDIRSVNTPQNRMKMDFDLSSLPGNISQQIANQYKDNIRDFKEANNNYLSVCKASPLTATTNTELHELFKASVAKADARYAQMKAEADKAIAEANKAKAEADRAKAEADRAKYTAEQAQAERAKIEAEKASSKAKDDADAWCKGTIYTNQWANSFKEKRILECLQISPEKRLRCINTCMEDPDMYRWTMTGSVSICFNSPIYNTEDKRNHCIYLVASDCINGCFGLKK